MSVRLKVFVSSGMEELRQERQTVKASLDQLEVDAWIFEEDAGAQSLEARQVYLEELAGSHLYVGVFWRKYGEYTIDEYRQARRQGKDCLIFEKYVDIDARDGRLTSFLAEIGRVDSGGHTIKRFTTTEELGQEVRKAVAYWQLRRIRQETHRAIPPLLTFRCDREDQIRVVQGAAREVRRTHDARNIVCIVHGRRIECLRELVEVVARYCLPRAVHDGGPKPVREIAAAWPKNAETAAQFRAHMVSSLSEFAFRRILEAEELAAELDAYQGPVLVHVIAGVSDLRREPNGAIERFVQFWNEWPCRSSVEPLFAFLCLVYEDSPAGGLWSRLGLDKRARVNEAVRLLLRDRTLIENLERNNPHTRVLVTREVGAVGQDEAELWASLDEVVEFVGARFVDVRAQINALFEGELADEERRISMRPLASNLEAILTRVRS